MHSVGAPQGVGQNCRTLGRWAERRAAKHRQYGRRKGGGTVRRHTQYRPDAVAGDPRSHPTSCEKGTRRNQPHRPNTPITRGPPVVAAGSSDPYYPTDSQLQLYYIYTTGNVLRGCPAAALIAIDLDLEQVNRRRKKRSRPGPG